MAAHVTNPFSATWGAYAMGGTTERLIVGLHRLSDSFDRFEVSFDVAIRGTTDALFADAVEEIHEEFAQARRRKIEWKVGVETAFSFDPDDAVNTGLNSWATLSKPGTPGGDTDRSRIYTVTMGCEKPAADEAGRRDSSVAVDYDAAEIRTVTIEGTWTALGSKNATEQYADEIEAYCTSVLSALEPAGDFERVAQRTRRDDEDKVLVFSRTYQQLPVAQPGASGSLDDPQIRAFKVDWSRAIDSALESGSGVVRLQDVTATGHFVLDHTATTNVESKWKTVVRPYLKDQLRAVFEPQQFGISHEAAGPIPFGNGCTFAVVFKCAIGTNPVVRSTITGTIHEEDGRVETGRWSGDAFDIRLDQGHATRLAIMEATTTVLGTTSPAQRLEPGPASSGWVDRTNDSSTTTEHFGLPGEDQIVLTTRRDRVVSQFTSSGSGAGGGFGVEFDWSKAGEVYRRPTYGTGHGNERGAL